MSKKYILTPCGNARQRKRHPDKLTKKPINAQGNLAGKFFRPKSNCGGAKGNN